MTSTLDLLSNLETFLWPEQDGRQRQKRQRILQAATNLFVRFGYRKTSMEAVAQQAGVAKGTVYLYYRNKAELVYHAVALEKSNYADRAEPLNDPSIPAQERLRSLIALGISLSREMPLTKSLVQGDHEISLALSEIDSSVLVSVAELQTRVIHDLLDEATGHCWPESLLQINSQVLLDLTMALTISEQFNTAHLPLDIYANAVADLLINGVLNQGPTTKPADRSAGKPSLQPNQGTVK